MADNCGDAVISFCIDMGSLYCGKIVRSVRAPPVLPAGCNGSDESKSDTAAFFPVNPDISVLPVHFVIIFFVICTS